METPCGFCDPKPRCSAAECQRISQSAFKSLEELRAILDESGITLTIIIGSLGYYEAFIRNKYGLELNSAMAKIPLAAALVASSHVLSKLGK